MNAIKYTNTEEPSATSLHEQLIEKANKAQKLLEAQSRNNVNNTGNTWNYFDIVNDEDDAPNYMNYEILDDVEDQTAPVPTSNPVINPPLEKIEGPTAKAETLVPSKLANSKLETAKYISQYLQKNLGLSAQQAAGILTHINGESSFNVGAENAAEKAGKNSAVKANEYGRGLIQWTGSRANALEQFVAANGGKKDLDTQLAFMVDEIKNRYDNFYQNLLQAKDEKEAATLAYLQYVGGGNRYKTLDWDKIYADADAMSNRYQAKHKELGYKVQNHYQKRRDDAYNYIFAKLGGKFPKYLK